LLDVLHPTENLKSSRQPRGLPTRLSSAELLFKYRLSFSASCSSYQSDRHAKANTTHSVQQFPRLMSVKTLTLAPLIFILSFSSADREVVLTLPTCSDTTHEEFEISIYLAKSTTVFPITNKDGRTYGWRCKSAQITVSDRASVRQGNAVQSRLSEGKEVDVRHNACGFESLRRCTALHHFIDSYMTIRGICQYRHTLL
jgi:hypothetical protein